LREALIATFGSFAEVIAAPRPRLAELKGLRNFALSVPRARQASRTQDVMACVSCILAVLPEAERNGMTAQDWMSCISERDISFEEAIENELPIEEERERQRAARQAEAEAKEAARQEAERMAQRKRPERLVAASGILGPDGSTWIEAANPRFSGQRPVEMARSGEDGLKQVLEEVDREARRRQAQREREEKDCGVSDRAYRASDENPW
jgi:hypothetical protein